MASCLAAGVAFVPTSSVAAPGDPSLAEVRDQVAAANHAAEQASERALDIALSMKGTQSQIKALRGDVQREQSSVDAVRADLGSTIADQLTSSPMGPSAQLLSSKDPDGFLEGLSILQTYTANQADLLTSFEQKAKQLEVRKDQLRSKLAVIAAAEQQMVKEKSTLAARAAEAKALLARLTPVQRTAVTRDAHATTSRGDDRPAIQDPKGAAATPDAVTPDATTPDATTPDATTPDAAAPATGGTGRAQAAISFGLGQVGDPYVYGAAGPGSWDCSGLMMGAWGAAGVSLPHSSAAQSQMGSSVSTSSMQPGDLVFYYSPVSHVGLYIGGGKLLHAPHPGASVEVVPVDEMPINSVRRVG